MKARHIAVLALIGWYLLAPPKLNGSYVTGAPLTRWFQYGVYDSAADCEKGKEHAAEKYPGPQAFFASWRCIASDDPRLKGK